jgi:uncharacterized protein YceK
MQTKLMRKFLLPLMIFAVVCSGCAGLGARPPTIRPIYKECLMGLKYVKFSESTWAWLEANKAPRSVISDLGKVAKNNEKLVTKCENIVLPADK